MLIFLASSFLFLAHLWVCQIEKNLYITYLLGDLLGLATTSLFIAKNIETLAYCSVESHPIMRVMLLKVFLFLRWR